MKNDDVELVKRILAGDESAFAILVCKYQEQVHSHAWRKTGDYHIAEDITQDAFLQVYKKLETLEDPMQFSRWLYTIVNHLCIAWFRKNKMQTELLEALDVSDIETEAYSQYVASEYAETVNATQRDLVKRPLGKLKERDREVITLHYFEEMTSSEIGTYLGVSENTVKSRIRRARQRLRQYEFMIHESLDITSEREHIPQDNLKGDTIMAREDKDELNLEEINENLTKMQIGIADNVRMEMSELRDYISSLIEELHTAFDISSPPLTHSVFGIPSSRTQRKRSDALKTLSTLLPEDATNHVAWGYVGAYQNASNSGNSRIAYWSDSLDIFLNKAPDPDIINFASLFTNPAIIAILRELVNGEKSVSDLVEASGMSESDIEKGVKTLSDATLVVRTDEDFIKPNNDVISYFLNFVSMTIVHLGHIKPKTK